MIANPPAAITNAFTSQIPRGSGGVAAGDVTSRSATSEVTIQMTMDHTRSRRTTVSRMIAAMGTSIGLVLRSPLTAG